MLTIRSAAAILLWCGHPAFLQAPNEPPAFRSNVNLVTVPVVLRDGSGHSIGSLHKNAEDFTDDRDQLRDTLNRIAPRSRAAHSGDCPNVSEYMADAICSADQTPTNSAYVWHLKRGGDCIRVRSE